MTNGAPMSAVLNLSETYSSWQCRWLLGSISWLFFCLRLRYLTRLWSCNFSRGLMPFSDASLMLCKVSAGVPRQLFLPVWRQLFLPVHLLGLAPLLGCIGAVAGDVKLQDDGVMDHSIDGRGGGHGVGEDVFPLREDQV